jgi:hypothetical protein
VLLESLYKKANPAWGSRVCGGLGVLGVSFCCPYYSLSLRQQNVSWITICQKFAERLEKSPSRRKVLLEEVVLTKTCQPTEQ